jgi:hypothetical protein
MTATMTKPESSTVAEFIKAAKAHECTSFLCVHRHTNDDMPTRIFQKPEDAIEFAQRIKKTPAKMMEMFNACPKGDFVCVFIIGFNAAGEPQPKAFMSVDKEW